MRAERSILWTDINRGERKRPAAIGNGTIAQFPWSNIGCVSKVAVGVVDGLYSERTFFLGGRTRRSMGLRCTNCTHHVLQRYGTASHGVGGCPSCLLFHENRSHRCFGSHPFGHRIVPHDLYLHQYVESDRDVTPLPNEIVRNA